jgi:hypothetical protein
MYLPRSCDDKDDREDGISRLDTTGGAGQEAEVGEWLGVGIVCALPMALTLRAAKLRKGSAP